MCKHDRVIELHERAVRREATTKAAMTLAACALTSVTAAGLGVFAARSGAWWWFGATVSFALAALFASWTVTLPREARRAHIDLHSPRERDPLPDD